MNYEHFKCLLGDISLLLNQEKNKLEFSEHPSFWILDDSLRLKSQINVTQMKVQEYSTKIYSCLVVFSCVCLFVLSFWCMFVEVDKFIGIANVESSFKHFIHAPFWNIFVPHDAFKWMLRKSINEWMNTVQFNKNVTKINKFWL